MNIGTQLMVTGTGAKDYFTPWLSKAADNAYFTYEVIDSNFASGGSFVVLVYTKNRDEAGSVGSVTSVSFTQIGSSNFYQAACSDLRELVRFKLTVTAGTSPASPEGVTYRFLQPTWYDKAV